MKFYLNEAIATLKAAALQQAEDSGKPEKPISEQEARDLVAYWVKQRSEICAGMDGFARDLASFLPA